VVVTRNGRTATRLGSSSGAPSPRRATAQIPSAASAATPPPTNQRRSPPLVDRPTAGMARLGSIPPLGVPIASSRDTISSAVCHRSAGFFSRQRITSSASGAGTEGRRRVTGAGASVRCAASTAWAVLPTNGGVPFSIS
jgi:hypothetical protein